MSDKNDRIDTKNDVVEFVWPGTGTLRVEIKNTYSARMRFIPAEEVVMEHLTKHGITPGNRGSGGGYNSSSKSGNLRTTEITASQEDNG